MPEQVTLEVCGTVIELLVGDDVQVALTPYDLTNGRITYRFT